MGSSSTCCNRRASQAANSETLVMRDMPDAHAVGVQDIRQGHIHPEQADDAEELPQAQAPGKAPGEDSAVPSPIMVASLAQLTGDCGALTRRLRDETVVWRDDLDARRRRGRLPARLIERVNQTPTLKERCHESFHSGQRRRTALPKSALLVLGSSRRRSWRAGAAGAARPTTMSPAVVVKYSEQSLSDRGRGARRCIVAKSSARRDRSALIARFEILSSESLAEQCRRSRQLPGPYAKSTIRSWRPCMPAVRRTARVRFEVPRSAAGSSETVRCTTVRSPSCELVVFGLPRALQ